MAVQPLPGGQSEAGGPLIDLVTDPVEAAKAAGLRYVTDKMPGIRRKRVGENFTYIGVDGQPIYDPPHTPFVIPLTVFSQFLSYTDHSKYK